MKVFASLLFAAALEAGLGDNAALRYWSAFAQMQDAAMTDQDARQLNAILDGTAPYADLKYRDLVERNRRAVETLLRGASLADCDWGLEYAMGSEAPAEYLRKSLALGRLTVLYAFHQLQVGDRAGGMQTLAGGLRFAQHVAVGGPLFAALAAKTLMVTHLRAIDFAAHAQALSTAEKKMLSGELARLRLDWESAIVNEFEVLRRSGAAPPAQVVDLYRRAINRGAPLSAVEQAITAAPRQLASRIPAPTRVLEHKREFEERVQRSRALVH